MEPPRLSPSLKAQGPGGAGRRVLLTPSGGFTNFGNGFAPLRYHVDALGYVHVQAALTNRPGAPLGAGTALATRPPGARPALKLVFASESTSAFIAITLDPLGRFSANAAVPIGNQLTLNLTYLAEQ